MKGKNGFVNIMGIEHCIAKNGWSYSGQNGYDEKMHLYQLRHDDDDDVKIVLC
jgi:hypothetical protein